MTAIVKDETVPVFVNAFPRVRVFVQVSPIEISERPLIGWKVRRHPVENDSDAALMEVTDNWRLERIGAIERSVLRLGAAELSRGEAPPRVVIQEAVRLAERFGTSASARFVNGVLDAYARRAGVL